MVLAWLARREHSRSEIAAKLRRKGCAPEVADQVVEVLAGQGLLSDERFAEAVVHSRRQKGYGPVRIRKELEEKGLDGEAAARCVDVRSEGWIAEIERVRRKRFGDEAPRSREEYARQVRFLQYRGFTYEQIRRVLDTRYDD